MMPWWLTLIIALVPAVIAGAVTLHISRKSQLNKQADAMRSTEQKAKPEQRPSPEQQPSKEFAVLKEQLDAIQKDIGKTPDDKTLTGQNKDLKELLQKEIETAERRYTESDKRLRDFTLAQHNTAKVVKLFRDFLDSWEVLTGEYNDISSQNLALKEQVESLQEEQQRLQQEIRRLQAHWTPPTPSSGQEDEGPDIF